MNVSLFAESWISGNTRECKKFERKIQPIHSITSCAIHRAPGFYVNNSEPMGTCGKNGMKFARIRQLVKCQTDTYLQEAANSTMASRSSRATGWTDSGVHACIGIFITFTRAVAKFLCTTMPSCHSSLLQHKSYTSTPYKLFSMV